MFNLRNASNGSSVLFRFILNTTGPLLAAIPKICVLKVDGKVATKHELYKNGGKMFMTFTKVQPLASKDKGGFPTSFPGSFLYLEKLSRERTFLYLEKLSRERTLGTRLVDFHCRVIFTCVRT